MNSDDISVNDDSIHASNTHRQARDSADQLVRGLAWFSIALGAIELLAPRRVVRAAGMDKDETLLRLYGLREIGAGVGLLVADDKKPWLIGRLAGDALDLSTLAARVGNGRSATRTLAAIASVAAVTWLDLKATRQHIQQDTQATGLAFDYSDRSGFSSPPAQMRGVGRQDAAQRESKAAAVRTEEAA
jgi:hypothetical protein